MYRYETDQIKLAEARRSSPDSTLMYALTDVLTGTISVHRQRRLAGTITQVITAIIITLHVIREH